MILYLSHGDSRETLCLTLPASPSDVKKVDDMLCEIGRYEGLLRIKNVESTVKRVWHYIQNANPLDSNQLQKLNRLAEYVDTMNKKKANIFSGALYSESIGGLDDVLRTAEKLDLYDIIPEVTCDRELGGYLVDHGVIDCPERLKPYLDYVGIGAEYYDNHGGAYTLGGYVVKKSELPIQLRASEPEPWRNEERRELISMTLHTDQVDSYLLVLPAEDEYLSDAAKFLGINDFAEAEIQDVQFKVPYIGELMQTLDCPSVEEYNDFAAAMEEILQQDGKLLTYAAVLDAEWPETLHCARELLQELDNYQRVTDAYDYGQQRLKESLGMDDEGIYELEDYMDFEKYGRDCMENDGVVITEFGRLRCLEPPFTGQSLQMFQ